MMRRHAMASTMWQGWSDRWARTDFLWVGALLRPQAIEQTLQQGGAAGVPLMQPYAVTTGIELAPHVCCRTDVARQNGKEGATPRNTRRTDQ